MSGNNLPRIILILASYSQTCIYTLFPTVASNCVCCCQSRWLSRGNRCGRFCSQTAMSDAMEKAKIKPKCFLARVLSLWSRMSQLTHFMLSLLGCNGPLEQ